MAKYKKSFSNPHLYRQFSNSPSEMFDYTMTNIMDGFYDEAMSTSIDDVFKAVCLSGINSESNTGEGTGGNDAVISGPFINLIVRPLADFGNIIPDPRISKDPNEINALITLHASTFTARSDEGFDITRGIDFGQVIDCYFEKGSISNSDFRTLRFSQPKGKIIETSFQDLSLISGVTTMANPDWSGASMLGAYHGLGPPDGNGVMIQGSVYPHDPIRNDKKIHLSKEIVDEYIPAREKALANESLGLRLLATSMAIKEGFRKNTRSYKHNNPGNIGNTDSGANVQYPTLEAGIERQATYIKSIASGTHKSYPIGKKKTIKPYYSEEIAKNQKTYEGKSPYLPGYEFTYTGQLDQFVKIYATGARNGNSYLSMIISYFKQNGIDINNESKIQEII